MLGKSPIKWRQRPDMTIAVNWVVKHQLKQTKTNMHTGKKEKKRKIKRENASSLHVSVSLTGLVFLFPHPVSRVLSKS